MINKWTPKEQAIALFKIRFPENLNADNSVKPYSTSYFNEWINRLSYGKENALNYADTETAKAINQIYKDMKELTISEFLTRQ